MKVCQRGWEYAQITDENGTVEICSWATANFQPIGSLSDNSMYEIWHGEVAERFRDSLRDGSYRYCEKQRCPWLANGTLDEHLIEYDYVPEYPKDISLSYDRACNYKCTCCADSETCGIPCSESKEKNKHKIENELKKFINEATTFSANGRGELFASPEIIKMLGQWEPSEPTDKINVILESNGSMFNEKNWNRISNLGKYNLKVTITVMSFDEEAYQFLSGTALPIRILLENLHFIRSLREKNIVNCFEIGTVVQERNFREMPSFIRRCVDEFGVDIVRLRSYFPFGDKDPGAKWLYDIRNKHHPYYAEYERILNDEAFLDPHVMMWSGDELSRQTISPFEQMRMNYEIIKTMFLKNNILGIIENNLIILNRNIVIYGLGDVGEAFFKVASKSDLLRIVGIIDRKKSGMYEGVRICTLDDFLMENVAIVVSLPYAFSEISSAILEKKRNVMVLNVLDVIKSN